MKCQLPVRTGWVAAVIIGVFTATGAEAVIPGLTGSSFSLTAKTGYISAADGLSVHTWGYADGAGVMQYPGPTLIVNEGAVVTIDLRNELPQPTSIVFPGQDGVTASAIVGTGVPGMLTLDAPAASAATTTIRYTFTASRPGTYQYHSGTRPDLQVGMGLVGALIVRPAGFPLDQLAYNHLDSAFDREYLFLFTEMDYDFHWRTEVGLPVDTTTFHPVYWFINGRNLPDTVSPAGVPWLPSQPYSAMVRMHPGEQILMRSIGGGRDVHPLHAHGNSHKVIARDGRLLQTAPGTGADLTEVVFTANNTPGQTEDGIFFWTGYKLGWDIYGHAPGDPLEPFEYAPDHGKPFPVLLPNALEVTFGPGWSGSPFLGSLGDLPPGEGGWNFFGGLMFPWHSHHEKEAVNNDIFPGGMFTLLIIEDWATPIP